MRCKLPPPKDWYEYQERELIYNCPDCCGDYIAIYRADDICINCIDIRGISMKRAIARFKEMVENDTHYWVCQDAGSKNGWWNYFQKKGGFKEESLEIWHESEICCTRLI